jgi:hypothetical protein
VVDSSYRLNDYIRRHIRARKKSGSDAVVLDPALCLPKATNRARSWARGSAIDKVDQHAMAAKPGTTVRRFPTCCVADFQSAARPKSETTFEFVPPAGWKPAIQQVGNLR